MDFEGRFNNFNFGEVTYDLKISEREVEDKNYGLVREVVEFDLRRGPRKQLFDSEGLVSSNFFGFSSSGWGGRTYQEIEGILRRWNPEVTCEQLGMLKDYLEGRE